MERRVAFFLMSDSVEKCCTRKAKRRTCGSVVVPRPVPPVDPQREGDAVLRHRFFWKKTEEVRQPRGEAYDLYTALPQRQTPHLLRGK